MVLNYILVGCPWKCNPIIAKPVVKMRPHPAAKSILASHKEDPPPTPPGPLNRVWFFRVLTVLWTGYTISLFGILNRVSFWTRSLERRVNFSRLQSTTSNFFFLLKDTGRSLNSADCGRSFHRKCKHIDKFTYPSSFPDKGSGLSLNTDIFKYS